MWLRQRHAKYTPTMKTTTISKGGQISVPAEIRRRWGATRLFIEDRGDALVLRPIPADPIGAAMGSLKGVGAASDDLRRRARSEEAERDEERAQR
jgi:bifunctional DNA-binding transcriptional regulator/antitoxin component of YhaV-PrlF toxin-antitoxin module